MDVTEVGKKAFQNNGLPGDLKESRCSLSGAR